MIEVRIEGLAELQAACARSAAVLDRTVDDALLEAAQGVQKRASSGAPRRTGRLASSIEVFTERGAAGVVVTARARSDGYPYGIKIEREQPYLAPAFQAEAQRIDQLTEQVGNEIARTWGGT